MNWTFFFTFELKLCNAQHILVSHEFLLIVDYLKYNKIWQIQLEHGFNGTLKLLGCRVKKRNFVFLTRTYFMTLALADIVFMLKLYFCSGRSLIIELKWRNKKLKGCCRCMENIHLHWEHFSVVFFNTRCQNCIEN